MAIRLGSYNGSYFADGEILYAADLNETLTSLMTSKSIVGSHVHQFGLVAGGDWIAIARGVGTVGSVFDLTSPTAVIGSQDFIVDATLRAGTTIGTGSFYLYNSTDDEEIGQAITATSNDLSDFRLLGSFTINDVGATKNIQLRVKHASTSTGSSVIIGAALSVERVLNY